MVEYLGAWLGMQTDRRGVTMLEYGLIGALIAAVCVTAITAFGTNLSAEFNTVSNSI